MVGDSCDTTRRYYRRVGRAQERNERPNTFLRAPYLYTKMYAARPARTSRGGNMPDITTWGTRCLACVAFMSSAALAQRAPVPGQLLDARTVFVGNGGSESYGADSYFRLTRYDGGPDRP